MGHNIINNNLDNNLNNNLERTREPEPQPQAAPQPQRQVLKVYVPTMEEREQTLQAVLDKDKARRDAMYSHLSPERRAHEESLARSQALKVETYK